MKGHATFSTFLDSPSLRRKSRVSLPAIPANLAVRANFMVPANFAVPGERERVKGVEPSTATLATWCSTTELHPHGVADPAGDFPIMALSALASSEKRNPSGGGCSHSFGDERSLQSHHDDHFRSAGAREPRRFSGRACGGVRDRPVRCLTGRGSRYRVPGHRLKSEPEAAVVIRTVSNDNATDPLLCSRCLVERSRSNPPPDATLRVAAGDHDDARRPVADRHGAAL
jgi:hypothetical protein